MEEAQEKLSHEVIEVSGGGSAVSIKISGSENLELTLDLNSKRGPRVCFRSYSSSGCGCK